MRRALAIALATAGCFSDRGLAIEVDVGGLDVTSVELFVGNAKCTAGVTSDIRCTGIEPDDPRRRLDGDVYFRTDTKAYTSTVHGGKATFRLEADADTELPIVVLIGTASGQAKGAATLTKVHVLANDSLVQKTTLKVAGPITASTTALAEERFHVWAQPDDDKHTCVAIEHWSGGNVTRDLIVAEDDPDCDGYAGALECDAEVYKSAHPAPTAAPTCFAGMMDETCLLGTEGCVDGSGLTNACDPYADQVCVPDRFCECAGPRGGEACDPRTNPAYLNVPHIVCNVAVTNLAGDLCQSETDGFKLDEHFAAGDCGNKPVLSGPRLADLASAADTLTFHGAELSVSHTGNGCGLQLKVSGKHDLTPEVGMLEVTGRGGTMIVPIAMTFAPGPCIQKRLDCRLQDVATDHLWDCVAPR